MIQLNITKNFRPDIEGLRCIAVLSVLLFHINPHWLPGGFIGVDIFFVISGYLISRNILSAIQQQKFHFKKFYLNRFVRLYPALFATIAFSTYFGWKLLTPEDFVQFSKSAIFSTFGLSNFYYYWTIDYFNNQNIIHPLLHTWSLGVEEQFYLLWPLLIFFLAKSFKNIKVFTFLFCGIIVVGFFATLFIGEAHPLLTFYLMPFRIFQFLFGFFIMLIEKFINNKTHRLAKESIFIAGMTLTLASFFIFSEKTPWPGSAALLPTIASGMVILVGNLSSFHAILTNRLAGFFGKISYSLYLVHWPIIVFYRYHLVVPPQTMDYLKMGVLSLVLGWIFYEIFEKRFSSKGRSSKNKHDTPKYALPSLLITLITLMIISTTIIQKQGFPERLGSNKVSAQQLSFAGDTCHADKSRCIFGDKTSNKTIYVVGDSHALNLIYGLDHFLKKENIKGIALYDHGCLFLKDFVTYVNNQPDKKCGKNLSFTLDFLANSSDPILFSNNYKGYIDSSGQPLDKKSYLALLKTSLSKTLNGFNLQNRKVFLLSSSYDTGVDLSRCLLSPTRNDSCKPWSLIQHNAAYQDFDSLLIQADATSSNIYYLDTKTAFCNSNNCQVLSQDNELFFRDTQHLTNEGSLHLVKTLGPQILEILNSKRSE